MSFANTNYRRERTGTQTSATFSMSNTTVGINALKAQVEGTYGVSFAIVGVDPNWNIVLSGPTSNLKRAMNFLFPRKDSGSVNNFQTLP